MKIEVNYSEAETTAIIMAANVAQFGAAPEGCEWVGNHTYSGKYCVVTREIEAEPETDEDIQAADSPPILVTIGEETQ